MLILVLLPVFVFLGRRASGPKRCDQVATMAAFELAGSPKAAATILDEWAQAAGLAPANLRDSVRRAVWWDMPFIPPYRYTIELDGKPIVEEKVSDDGWILDDIAGAMAAKGKLRVRDHREVETQVEFDVSSSPPKESGLVPPIADRTLYLAGSNPSHRRRGFAVTGKVTRLPVRSMHATGEARRPQV